MHKIMHMLTIALGTVVIIVTTAFELAIGRFVSKERKRAIEYRCCAIDTWAYDTLIHNGPGPNAGQVCPAISWVVSKACMEANNGNSHGTSGGSMLVRAPKQL